MPSQLVESPVVDLDLSLPPSERYDYLSLHLVERGKALLAAIGATMPPNARDMAIAALEATDYRFAAEAAALAERHEVGQADIILANISYDLMVNSFGCTTVVLPTPVGPVVGRNMDWPPEGLLAKASCLLRYVKNSELRAPLAFAHAGWPGSIGVVTGCSGKGFCLVVNAASHPEPAAKGAYPVLLFLRKVLEDASGFDEALKMLTEQPLAAPAMITLAGSSNEQRVVIERSPSKAALRWGAEGKPLLTTNHYRVLMRPEEQESCPRYARASELLENASSLGARELLEILSDPGVIQDITAQHVVMRPVYGQVRLFVPARLMSA